MVGSLNPRRVVAPYLAAVPSFNSAVISPFLAWVLVELFLATVVVRRAVQSSRSYPQILAWKNFAILYFIQATGSLRAVGAEIHGSMACMPRQLSLYFSPNILVRW